MGLAERIRYTIDDYRHWKGDWELIDGFPIATAPGPFGVHQFIVYSLARILEEKLKKCPIIGSNCYLYPELDWIIDDFTVVRPDNSLICKKVREHNTTLPLLVAEVVLKSSRELDEVEKKRLYEKEWVRFYLLVLPHLQKVCVFELDENSYKKVAEDDRVVRFTIKGCEILLEPEELWEILQ